MMKLYELYVWIISTYFWNNIFTDAKLDMHSRITTYFKTFCDQNEIFDFYSRQIGYLGYLYKSPS